MDERWKYGTMAVTLFGLALLGTRRARAAPAPRGVRDWTREYSEYSQPSAGQQTIDPALDPNIDRELDPNRPPNTNYPVVDPNKPQPTGSPEMYTFAQDRTWTALPYVAPEPPTPTPQPPVQNYNTGYQTIPAVIDEGTPDISRGDRVVMEYQQKLQRLGYDPGPIDGRLGNLTRNAVRDFQRSHGLTVDGILGPRTKGAIDAAYNSQGGLSGFGLRRGNYGTGDTRFCRW